MSGKRVGCETEITVYQNLEEATDPAFRENAEHYTPGLEAVFIFSPSLVSVHSDFKVVTPTVQPHSRTESSGAPCTLEHKSIKEEPSGLWLRAVYPAVL